MSRRVILLVWGLVGLVGLVHSSSVPEPPVVTSSKRSKSLPIMKALATGLSLGSAVPACRRSIRNLFGRRTRTEPIEPSHDAPATAAAAEAAERRTLEEEPPSTKEAAAPEQPKEAEAEKPITLTPDRLAQISDVRAPPRPSSVFFGGDARAV